MTDTEKKELIIKEVENCYPKMVQDSIRICGYNAEKWSHDLLMHCLLELLEKKPLDYQYQLIIEDKKLKNYMGYAMSLQVKSGSSTFYNQYRRFLYNTRGVYEAYDKPADNFTEEISLGKENEMYRDKQKCVEYAIEQLDFYEQTLIKEKYIEGKTWDEIKNTYDFSLTAASRDLKKALKKIKNICNHF